MRTFFPPKLASFFLYVLQLEMAERQRTSKRHAGYVYLHLRGFKPMYYGHRKLNLLCSVLLLDVDSAEMLMNLFPLSLRVPISFPHCLRVRLGIDVAQMGS